MFQTSDLKKIAFITDIHGHEATFKALCSKIPKGYTIVCGGDLIDRGRTSKGVIQEIMDKGYLSVLGNHDYFMLMETDTKLWRGRTSLWYANGGNTTIRSYGGKWRIQNDPDKRAKFLEHRNFLWTLPLIIKFPNIKINGREVWVSHSPLDMAMDIAGTYDIMEKVLTECDKKYAYQNINSGEGTLVQTIFWRHWDDGKPRKDGKIPRGYPKDNFPFYNVTGHNSLWEPHIAKHFACLDTCVYYPNKLTALLLPDMKLITQETIEDTWEFKK